MGACFHDDYNKTFVPSILAWQKVRSSFRDTPTGGQMNLRENLRKYIRGASNYTHFIKYFTPI